jgi:hypothetical protein
VLKKRKYGIYRELRSTIVLMKKICIYKDSEEEVETSSCNVDTNTWMSQFEYGLIAHHCRMGCSGLLQVYSDLC